ncbi:hypothetical protein DMA12_44395 [Amycolatopsis balhimycina DSM 5908]|uniref:Uncharacterized protein n=1 Tax=Amycolatopsis balhimycina DSM 5908 TaxID=1081091 RepID=A0A428VXB8_AMYBA|nr:hypothetical protein [Amycolatopsis balhimycina]RSM35419.1 hypothetical protein DMA12_44395 [Amycolatopsis balhimycina DSM 5908]
MASRHALLIATEAYTDPALRRLTAPGGDARALADPKVPFIQAGVLAVLMSWSSSAVSRTAGSSSCSWCFSRSFSAAFLGRGLFLLARQSK